MNLPTDTHGKSSLLIWVQSLCNEDIHSQIPTLIQVMKWLSHKDGFPFPFNQNEMVTKILNSK